MENPKTKTKNNSLVDLGGLAEHSQEQIRYFHENKVYTLQIESTARCLQECIYCYAKANPKVNGVLNPDKIKSIIDEGKTLEIRMIDWLGGDPLLRNDWYQLMKYTQEQELVNNLWTSGILLEDLEIAEKVVEATENGYVSVHLDSLDEETFGRLHSRNGQNISNKILKGVDNLIALGKSRDNILNCITYTNLQTPEDVKRTIQWFWENKGIRTCLVLFKPAGFGNKMPELKPSLDNIKEVFEYRNETNYADSIWKLGTQDVNKFYCGTMFCITFDGKVTPCSVIRKSVSDIHQKNLQQIMEESLEDLTFTQMHSSDNLPVGCNHCQNNEVCWGCRANAWYYAFDIRAADPNCWLNSENNI